MKNFQFSKASFQRCVLLLLFVFSHIIYAKDIYVSKSGSDYFNGSKEKPFLTIAKATSVAFAGDTIIIGAGTYQETIRPIRSGKFGQPITYISQPGHRVIISAMQALSGWKKDRGALYKTKVNWDLGQENFVMHEDTPMDLARWPNNIDGNLFTLNSIRNDGGSGSNVSNNAFLTSSKIPNIDWKGGTVFFFGDRPGSGWLAWKAFITSSTSGRVNFNFDKSPNWIRTFHEPKGKGDFYLEGVKGALDYKNEWWFNPKTKELFVQLPGGVAPRPGKVKMRKNTIAVNLSGRSHIHLKNLAVFGGAIQMPSNSSHNVLYGVSSFFGNHTLGVYRGFSSGKQSVLLSGNNNRIEKCEIAFGAANGIKIEGVNNKVLNSRIHDFNYLGSYDAPINTRSGRKSLIKGNTIFNSGRDGVQFFNTDSEFSYNDVSRSNLIADDCALIYTSNGKRNGKIHHNWFHDNYGRGKLKKAAAIYLDNDSSSILVHHNVIWNIAWTGVQINWDGKDIDVFNNTIFNTAAEMGAWHKPGTAFSDVRVWNNVGFKGSWEPQSNKQKNITVSKHTFINADKGNFRLKSNSPAINKGRKIGGITNGYVGAAPDIGAYEHGGSNWMAGIDWNPDLGPTGNGCYGLPGEACRTDAVDFVNPPNNIFPATTYNVKVKYEAASTRDIVVEFWSATKWLGGKTITVAKGKGQKTIAVKLSNPPGIGSGYLFKTYIKPVGSSWQAAIDFKQHEVSVIEENIFDDKVAFQNPKKEVPSKTTYYFDVAYEASSAREIVVEFWSATKMLGVQSSNVEQGKGVKQFKITLANPPAPGGGYVYKTYIKPIGATWQDTLDRDRLDNVVVTKDKVAFYQPKKEIPSKKQYTIRVKYTAYQRREIIVELWSATTWLGYGMVKVNKGSGIASVRVNLPNAPNAGTGYYYKTHIRPIGTDWQSALDKAIFQNVTVFSNFANLPPTVRFVGIEDEEVFEEDLDLEIQAEATDQDGKIVSVALYVNEKLVRKEYTAPYIWGNRPDLDEALEDMDEGVYKLKIVATDDKDDTASATITIQVLDDDTALFSDGIYTIASSQNAQRILARSIENHRARMINPANFNDQRWVFKHLGKNIYTIKNLSTKRFLEVPFGACGNNKPVATWVDNLGNHKKWKIKSIGTAKHPAYALFPKHCPVYALDRTAGKKDALLQIWDFQKTNPNQNWKIQAVTQVKQGYFDNAIQKISITPNPSEDWIQIQGVQAGENIEIYDIKGKRIRKQTLFSENERISIDKLQSGMYFISCFGKEKVKFIKK